MDKEQAEALAIQVRQEAPHLQVTVKPCVEVFQFMQGKDDGTYCCELYKPDAPSPSTLPARLARILESEDDWQSTKNTWRFVERFF